MIAYAVVLTLLFIVPLAHLMMYAAGSDLHSHIVLVPIVSACLLHDNRSALPEPGPRSVIAAVALSALGLAVLGAAFLWRASLSFNDHLALMALAYVCLLAAGGFLFNGAAWMRAAAFPLAFLVFLIPLPDRLVYSLEWGSVYASAEASAMYFWLAGTPVFREGTVFHLPGISLEVAKECSGIRSSWVLFITSVLAAQMFLKNPWHRVVLVLFVVPLGILRNGFRVFVIGMLCVHVGPHMVDSVFHHRGGPIFFVLSLGPLLLLVWWLRSRERRGSAPTLERGKQEPAPAE